MTTALIVLLILANAALFRLRGSHIWYQLTGRGATTIRLLWASGLALTALAVSASFPVWAVPLLALAFWVGAVFPYWSSLDMGTKEGTEIGDFVKQTARGMLWTVTAAWLLFFLGFGHPLYLILAGALYGPILLASWKLTPGRATENAEWVFGAGVAVSLIYTVVV